MTFLFEFAYQRSITAERKFADIQS